MMIIELDVLISTVKGLIPVWVSTRIRFTGLVS